MNYAETLFRDGVVVIPAFTPGDLQLYHQAFWDTVNSFPEYLNHDLLVQGAFGALGNPASFHNSLVRNLRLNLMFRAVPLFSELERLNGTSRNLEQLIDRMSIRRAGTSLGKESWHRDQAPTSAVPTATAAIAKETVFGGWVNLDLTNEQRFSCIPGSHPVHPTQAGFVREEQVDESLKRIYSVPPGHWIVFYQNILHEVLPGKVRFNSIRVYFGWRLTSSDQPLFNHDQVLTNQAVPYIPSGQLPTMYSPTHISFHSKATIEWAKIAFKPQCLEIKNTPKLGQYIIVHKNMRSLRDYQLLMYPDYNPEELFILKPSRTWQINSQQLQM